MADRRPIGWLSLLLWVLASGVGWGLIPFLALGVIIPVFRALFSEQTITGPTEFTYALQAAILGLLLGVLLGAVTGVLQWLILRRHIAQAYWWIAATAAGLGLGIALGFVSLRPMFAGATSAGGSYYFMVLAGLVPGVITGLLQRQVLRRHFNRAWWWMLPSALTWPVYLVYSMENIGDISLAMGRATFLAEVGLVTGAISGVALFLISRKRREGVTEPTKAEGRRGFYRWAVTAVALLAVITGVTLAVTFSYSSRGPELTLEGHTEGVTDVAFSSDGELLASASNDGTVRIWRADKGKLLHTLEHMRVEPYMSGTLSVTFSPDGETLAAGAGDNTVKLWRVADGALLHTLPDAGYRVAFSPDGSTLASFSVSQTLQRTITLWSVTDGEPVRTLEDIPVTEFCNSLEFSPDGTILAGGFQEGAIIMWRVEDGALLHTLRRHEPYYEVYVAFSPDGKTLASASWDGKVMFWRVDDGALLNECVLGSMCGLAFSADGSTLVSASADYRVYFWNVADGALLQTIVKEEHNQQCVAFSPDLKTMASGDMFDRVIRIYDIEQ